MKSLVAGLVLLLPVTTGAAPEAAKGTAPAAAQKHFASAKAALDAFVAAAEKFDVPELKEILGPDGVDLVLTQDAVQDRNQAASFASRARARSVLTPDAKNPAIVRCVIGGEDWPAPIPIVKDGKGWRFDTKAGRQEILYRRIGQNELDAIEICRGYVEAQHEYALERHEGVNQYAQKIVSTPGKRDGLSWRTPEGAWEGPVGEGIARAIAEGYTQRTEPYHGYYFKVLKGQGSSAPLGEMDFVVHGVMIGGFALVAAPADYAVTGVKTFIVSHDGVVYEKDLGTNTVDQFWKMQLFDPDASWAPVED